jgi:tetratricopeptide (TPR) repeat protein
MASGVRAADGPGAAAFAAMTQAWSAGNLDGALKAADKVLAAEPQNVAYLNAIGGLYCEQAQKANVLTRMSWAGKCRGTWERALVIDPQNLDIRFNLIQYYAMAPGIAGGGIGKAKDQANAIVALDGVRGEIAWGNIARAEKQLGEAERHYRNAADRDATGTRGPVALASFYVSQKRWKDARAVFEPRLAKNPGDTFAVYNLGRLLQGEGTDPTGALAYFDRYLAVAAAPGGPTHADAWFRKGEVLLKLGKKADAVSAFESALKLAPDHRGAAMALARAKSGGL